jgi:seryl-tRNA synthetase
LETYQQPDGSVAIPAVLQPYVGGRERLIHREGNQNAVHA